MLETSVNAFHSWLILLFFLLVLSLSFASLSWWHQLQLRWIFFLFSKLVEEQKLQKIPLTIYQVFDLPNNLYETKMRNFTLRKNTKSDTSTIIVIELCVTL